MPRSVSMVRPFLTRGTGIPGSPSSALNRPALRDAAEEWAVKSLLPAVSTDRSQDGRRPRGCRDREQANWPAAAMLHEQ